MKFFVLSDTHGKLDKVRTIYPHLQNIDLIIHLGDLQSDARALERELGADVVSVKGNMDGSYSRDDHQILETEYGRLLLTHGHMEHVKSGLQNLLYLTQERGCKAALFGHTHVPVFLEEAGIYLINPGSLTLPAGNSKGSYAIVNTSPEELTASIVYYSGLLEQPSKNPKVQGGFLKGLLNNSDRF